jgi:hypothetical protein
MWEINSALIQIALSSSVNLDGFLRTSSNAVTTAFAGGRGKKGDIPGLFLFDQFMFAGRYYNADTIFAFSRLAFIKLY